MLLQPSHRTQHQAGHKAFPQAGFPASSPQSQHTQDTAMQGLVDIASDPKAMQDKAMAAVSSAGAILGDAAKGTPLAGVAEAGAGATGLNAGQFLLAVAAVIWLITFFILGFTNIVTCVAVGVPVVQSIHMLSLPEEAAAKSIGAPQNSPPAHRMCPPPPPPPPPPWGRGAGRKKGARGGWRLRRLLTRRCCGAEQNCMPLYWIVLSFMLALESLLESIIPYATRAVGRSCHSAGAPFILTSV